MSGAALKENGQQLALFNAGHGWATEAVQRMHAFCAIRKAAGKGRFRFEEFVRWAQEAGLPAPASSNAWGSLPRLMVKEGLVEWTGEYENARSPKTHAHPVKVWMTK